MSKFLASGSRELRDLVSVELGKPDAGQYYYMIKCQQLMEEEETLMEVPHSHVGPMSNMILIANK